MKLQTFAFVLLTAAAAVAQNVPNMPDAMKQMRTSDDTAPTPVRPTDSAQPATMNPGRNAVGTVSRTQRGGVARGTTTQLLPGPTENITPTSDPSPAPSPSPAPKKKGRRRPASSAR